MQMCMVVPEMDWRPMRGELMPHSQFSWDRLQIHQDPDQDKVFTKDEWMNELDTVSTTQAPTNK